MLQRLTELVPGAMDVGLHGSEGQVEGGGDFLVRAALDMAQQNAGAILRAQASDGPFDSRSELPGLHLLEGILGPVRDIEARGFDRIGADRVRRAVDTHRVELATAQMVDCHVVRNLEQPRRELEVGAVAVEVGEDLDEGVLREVLGEFPVAHHAEDEREDRPLVSRDQLPMRGIAPLEGEGDDVGIGEVREVEGAEHLGGGDRAALMRAIVAQEEKYPWLTPQSSRMLARHPARDELSTMSDTDVETARAALAAEGGAEKRAYVRMVFEEIAPRYDLLNHLLSLNIDVLWRRRALRALEWSRLPDGRYLDLCAGTLDVGAELTKRAGFRGFIIGADFAVPMLRAGAGKASRHRLAPVGADAQQLPLGSGSMDGAVVAFGMRNVASLDIALREVHRVLAPGARFVILEFATPRSSIVRTFYHFYFHQVLPLVGGLISGHRTAYKYLPKSVAHFPAEPELARRMMAAGFRDVRWESLSFGIAAIHVGAKG